MQEWEASVLQPLGQMNTTPILICHLLNLYTVSRFVFAETVNPLLADSTSQACS